MKSLLIALCLICGTPYAKMNIETDSSGLPLLTQFSEEGFVDCVFRIESLTQTNQSYKFHLSSSHKSTVVGFDVEVVKNIQGGFDTDMKLIKEHVYYQGVKFFRSGPDSDRLLNELGTLYGLHLKKLTMVESESYTAISLQQGRLNMEEVPVKIKIFGRDKETDSEDDYNESFFNLDLKNGFVYWNEKDPDYREALIRGLSNDRMA
jgi:hypothetical protein